MKLLREFKPGRMVEIEQEYTCQRWPSDTILISPTGREVIVKELEFQGFWLGWTGKDNEGNRIERYWIIATYLVRVPSRHRDAYLHETEMREP